MFPSNYISVGETHLQVITIVVMPWPRIDSSRSTIRFLTSCVCVCMYVCVCVRVCVLGVEIRTREGRMPKEMKKGRKRHKDERNR